MSYIVDFNATFTRNLPGTSFLTWLDTVNFSDFSEFFPEMVEADWTAKKAEIVEVYNKTRPTVGATPGVASFSETNSSTSSNFILTFNTAEDYNTYTNYCYANKQSGMVPGFGFELPETTIENFVELNGRSITLVATNRVKSNPEIGEWLVAKYYIHYGITKSCIHTET